MFHRGRKIPPGRQSAFTRSEALDCVPVKNPQVTEQANGREELFLTYQVQIRPWFQNVVRKITGRDSTVIDRTLQLDTLGSSVWRLIDGRKSTREVIRLFRDANQLTSREAEISVTTFLKELGKRGLIVMRENRS